MLPLHQTANGMRGNEYCGEMLAVWQLVWDPSLDAAAAAAADNDDDDDDDDSVWHLQSEE